MAVYGAIRLPDRALRYVLYDGVGDMMQPQTFATPADVPLLMITAGKRWRL